jgi:hypothetical protein
MVHVRRENGIKHSSNKEYAILILVSVQHVIGTKSDPFNCSQTIDFAEVKSDNYIAVGWVHEWRRNHRFVMIINHLTSFPTRRKCIGGLRPIECLPTFEANTQPNPGRRLQLQPTHTM